MSIDLERIKEHLRVTHSIEDAVISDFVEFAKLDVIEAVFDSEDERLDKEKLEKNPTYQRAVINLTSFYYGNRLTIEDKHLYESPYSVTHAIQTLRAHKDRYLS